MVYQLVIDFEKLFEFGPSVKLTVWGAVPWAIFEEGVRRPSLKIPTILSKYLSLLMSIGCMFPLGHTFFKVKYSISAMSKLFGWVTTRWAVASVFRAVISSVIPRSSFAFLAISLMLETPVPNCRKVTFLMFWAQIVGKPVMAWDPTAAPSATALPRLRRSRREREVRVVGFFIVSLRKKGII